MDDGVEGQAVSPASGEISDVDVGVAGGLHLAPEEQRVLGRLGLARVRLFNGNILDL